MNFINNFIIIMKNMRWHLFILFINNIFRLYLVYIYIGLRGKVLLFAPISAKSWSALAFIEEFISILENDSENKIPIWNRIRLKFVNSTWSVLFIYWYASTRWYTIYCCCLKRKALLTDCQDLAFSENCYKNFINF